MGTKKRIINLHDNEATFMIEENDHNKHDEINIKEKNKTECKQNKTHTSLTMSNIQIIFYVFAGFFLIIISNVDENERNRQLC